MKAGGCLMVAKNNVQVVDGEKAHAELFHIRVRDGGRRRFEIVIFVVVGGSRVGSCRRFCVIILLYLFFDRIKY